MGVPWPLLCCLLRQRQDQLSSSEPSSCAGLGAKGFPHTVPFKSHRCLTAGDHSRPRFTAGETEAPQKVMCFAQLVKDGAGCQFRGAGRRRGPWTGYHEGPSLVSFVFKLDGGGGDFKEMEGRAIFSYKKSLPLFLVLPHTRRRPQ